MVKQECSGVSAERRKHFLMKLRRSAETPLREMRPPFRLLPRGDC